MGLPHNLFQAKDYDIELPPWCGIQILPFGGHEGSRFGRFDLARRPRLGRQEVNHLRISLRLRRSEFEVKLFLQPPSEVIIGGA